MKPSQDLSPFKIFTLINSENIDQLIPDFLMESEHFFLVLLDVEGNLINSNSIFSKVTGSSSGLGFQNFIDKDSARNFSDLLEKTLDSPKDVQHALFNIHREKSQTVMPVWWEFSLITNSDGDLMGVIGVGVGIQFLEQGMPWDNLVDVLQFGRIKLSSNRTVISLDDKVSNWVGQSPQELKGVSILNKEVFRVSQELELAFKQIYENGRPVCLVLKGRDSNLEFASFLTRVPDGFHLFILPREKNQISSDLSKPFSPQQLDALQGAVWVVNREFEIIQLNQGANSLGILWNGKELSEGLKFSFQRKSENFDKLISNCKRAFSGNQSNFELYSKSSNDEMGMWRVGIKPVYDLNGIFQSILIQAFDLSALNQRFNNLQKENQNLQELALRPSHILRSPLSSMLGLLDLIDQKQLDPENQKYFSYLKPLAKELDNVIRSNAKKMSALN